MVRRFVGDFYATVVPDPDAAHHLALATHELLENAAKYSADGEAALFVDVDPTSRVVCVRTANRASAARIAELETAFAEIAAAPSAAAHYLEAMRRSAVRASGSGGIGLARVWAEGDMELEMAVEGDRVEIRAQGVLASAVSESVPGES
jgi:hypothetical protein